MMKYTLNSKLPDVNLDPPEETPAQPWEDMTANERINSILDEFSPREVAEMYVELAGNLHLLTVLARAGNIDAIDRFIAKNRLDER